MLNSKYLALFFCLLLPVLGMAADSSADELIQHLDSLQSYQALFTQSVLDGRGRVIQQSTGLMTIQHPGKFRWETYKPMKQLLIADGKHIWFYDVALQQVTVQNQRAVRDNSPAMLLSGSTAELIQTFHVNKFDANTYQLKPKAKEGLFQAVRLTFSHDQLASMHIVDSLGQKTTIIFSQQQVNPSLDQKLFNFKVPQGVEVVRQ